MNYPRKVYAIQHNITKKTYVGTSADVFGRYRSHIYSLRSGKHPVEEMQKDFDEYGEDYSLYILDNIDSPEENKKEYEWMKKLQTFNKKKGYNYKELFKGNKVKMRDNEIPFQVGIPEVLDD